MSETNKKPCIVLLPSGHQFEQLFREVIEPAIARIGLLPSHPHWSASAPTPIDIFVDEIEQAGAVLADISENTPEIWLAVGCAVALGMPLCLISSRQERSAPLGIQHLPLIPYPASALPSDYVRLQQNIAAQLSALLPHKNIPEPKPQIPTPAQPPASKPSDDLVSYEIFALMIIDRQSPDTGLSPRDLSVEMQASEYGHLTSHAMTALRRRRFIERRPVQVSEKNEVHTSENLFVTRIGKDWLARHGRKATARRTAAHSRAQFLNGR